MVHTLKLNFCKPHEKNSMNISLIHKNENKLFDARFLDWVKVYKALKCIPLFLYHILLNSYSNVLKFWYQYFFEQLVGNKDQSVAMKLFLSQLFSNFSKHQMTSEIWADYWSEKQLGKLWFETYLDTIYRAVGRSENLGMPVVIRWA